MEPEDSASTMISTRKNAVHKITNKSHINLGVDHDRDPDGMAFEEATLVQIYFTFVKTGSFRKQKISAIAKIVFNFIVN